MLGWPALAVVGGLAAARRGQWAAPLMVLVAIPLMALVGGEYQPLPHASSRYLGSLWPALAALAGLGAVTLGRWLAVLAARTHAPDGWRRALGRLGPAAVAALCLVLVAAPALTVRSYLDWYGARPWLGSFNQFALDITDEAATRYPGRTVYLDTGLHEDGSSDAGTMYRSLAMLLGLRGNPSVALPRNQRQTARAVWERLDRAPGPAILRRDHASQFTAEGAHLTPVGAATRVLDPAVGEYRLYELTFTTAAG
jgi:hypothetical protein